LNEKTSAVRSRRRRKGPRRDDEWVPFAHLALYAEKVPQARFREFDERGHQFEDDLSEVAHDILSLGGPDHD
jgi:hypothetical protein